MMPHARRARHRRSAGRSTAERSSNRPRAARPGRDGVGRPDSRVGGRPRSVAGSTGRPQIGADRDLRIRHGSVLNRLRAANLLLPVGRLAQLEERHVHTVEVGRSRLPSPTLYVLVRGHTARPRRLREAARCTPGAQEFPSSIVTDRLAADASARIDTRQHAWIRSPDCVRSGRGRVSYSVGDGRVLIFGTEAEM
jgi:hypothetical protein